MECEEPVWESVTEGDDRDAVGPSVGVGSSGENDEVLDAGAVVFAEPVEVADVFVVDAGGEFDLDSDGMTVLGSA